MSEDPNEVMSGEELRLHLVRLLYRGADGWNNWRKENRHIKLDFSKLRFEGMLSANLYDVDFSDATFMEARFHSANLRRANFKNSDLSCANLDGADLHEANFYGANLICTNLGGSRGANLSGASSLSGSNLTRAEVSGDLTGMDLTICKCESTKFTDVKLNRANAGSAIFRNSIFNNVMLIGANIMGVDFSSAEFNDVDFTDATVGLTIFANNDLSNVKGLDNLRHRMPSTIGIDTISRSNGNIPEAFLLGCGLSDWQIENVKLFQPELSNEDITNILYRVHNLRAHQAIQITPLFISYSHADSPFVDKMETYLNEKGVRFWRDIHHSTVGRLEKQIDRAIRLNPTVLLILSNQSVKSDWVEHEARLARKLEQETGRDILCPIALDESWKTCRWPERLREQITEYNILDFSDWDNEDTFRRMFGRLIDGLDLFYK